MEDKIIEQMDKYIKVVMDEGLETNDNLNNLYKLMKIKHIAKEEESMNNRYSDSYRYGNSYGRERYGEYNDGSYGRRGYDTKYRGEDELDRMHGEYGRYQENRSRYGAGEETDRSFHYMVKALEDFIKVLYEEAETPQQRQMLSETMQRSMR